METTRPKRLFAVVMVAGLAFAAGCSDDEEARVLPAPAPISSVAQEPAAEDPVLDDGVSNEVSEDANPAEAGNTRDGVADVLLDDEDTAASTENNTEGGMPSETGARGDSAAYEGREAAAFAGIASLTATEEGCAVAELREHPDVLDRIYAEGDAFEVENADELNAVMDAVYYCAQESLVAEVAEESPELSEEQASCLVENIFAPGSVMRNLMSELLELSQLQESGDISEDNIMEESLALITEVLLLPTTIAEGCDVPVDSVEGMFSDL